MAQGAWRAEQGERAAWWISYVYVSTLRGRCHCAGGQAGARRGVAAAGSRGGDSVRWLGEGRRSQGGGGRAPRRLGPTFTGGRAISFRRSVPPAPGCKHVRDDDMGMSNERHFSCGAALIRAVMCCSVSHAAAAWAQLRRCALPDARLHLLCITATPDASLRTPALSRLVAPSSPAAQHLPLGASRH